MLYEERTYTLRPGSVAAYLKAYDEEGREIQTRILGNLIGFFHTEFGTLNQIVHIWAYESLDDRARRRAELWSNPQWLEYAAKMRPLLERMENRLLIPASFSPLK